MKAFITVWLVSMLVIGTVMLMAGNTVGFVCTAGVLLALVFGLVALMGEVFA